MKLLQVELLQKTHDSTASREQLDSVTRSLQEQLRTSEEQAAKMKRQLAIKGMPNNSTVELENSLRAMTDRLIRLQALNESLSNEKAALQLRLQSELQVRARIPPSLIMCAFMRCVSICSIIDTPPPLPPSPLPPLLLIPSQREEQQREGERGSFRRTAVQTASSTISLLADPESGDAYGEGRDTRT